MTTLFFKEAVMIYKKKKKIFFYLFSHAYTDDFNLSRRVGFERCFLKTQIVIYFAHFFHAIDTNLRYTGPRFTAKTKQDTNSLTDHSLQEQESVESIF